MRIVITGVSAYAGFHAAMRLSAEGHSVRGIARNPRGQRLQILRMHEIEIIEGDVSTPEGFREALTESDAVIHTMLDKKNPFGTDRALFRELESLPKRTMKRRFIYTTGCSIFGKVNAEWIDETQEPNPGHALAFRRQLECEALALKNVCTTVLRPGFMFGADCFNSVSADWFSMAESGAPVYRGDPEKGWSWIHIADLAAAFQAAVEATDIEVGGEVFHIADELRPRCVDVMRACVSAAGYGGEIRFEGAKDGDNISTWFDQNEFISSKKARQRLGWTTRHPGIIESADRVYRSWKASGLLKTG